MYQQFIRQGLWGYCVRTYGKYFVDNSLERARLKLEKFHFTDLTVELKSFHEEVINLRQHLFAPKKSNNDEQEKTYLHILMGKISREREWTVAADGESGLCLRNEDLTSLEL